MKNTLILGLLSSVALLSACGSGGSASPTVESGTNNNENFSKFPIGTCIKSGGQYLTPTLYENPNSFFTTITYSYLGLNDLSITYSEAESGTDSTVDTNPDLQINLPQGVCTVSSIVQLGKQTGLNGGKMYISNCVANMHGTEMNFTGNYAIYAKDVAYESGPAIESGLVNFTCDVVGESSAK